MNKFFIIIIIIFFFQNELLAQNEEEKSVLVKIKVYEATLNKITPVMTCITNSKNGNVIIPPYGEVTDLVSLTDIFYKGIEFNPNKNWIGPIRKMNGIGNNDNRSYVYDTLPSIPYWDAPVSYQTSGDFTIKLAPGAYTINLEHGNEFVPIKEEFIVPSNKKEIVKTFFIKRWINLPEMGWYSGDIHVHHPTNKPEFKEFLFNYAKAEDVHVVNLLEMGHHEGTDFKQGGFGEKFRLNKEDIWLISGQENPRSTYGHIIGLNINKLVLETSNLDYYDLTFKNLRKQEGALIGYAHFSWNGCELPRGFPWYITTGEIDFVELLQFSKINTLDYYDYLNLGFRITAAAGSDVPWGSTIGEVKTFVYTGKTFNADSWFKGFKNGNTFVSNGPALLLEADGNIPGTEILKAKGFVSKLKINAYSNASIGIIKRVAVYNSDGLITEKLNPEKSDTIKIELDHKVDKSQWLAAIVYCNNGAVAHTSPVYYVIDGKPTWSIEKAKKLIEKQKLVIKNIEAETNSNGIVDQGIIERLNMAKEFYQSILNEINKK
jgi:hypothetical protein